FVIAEQEQALTASIALANESITSGLYMYQLEDKRKMSFLTEQSGRVVNILVVREDGRIDDSLDPKYRPETISEGNYHYYNVSDPAVASRRTASVGSKGLAASPTVWSL